MKKSIQIIWIILYVLLTSFIAFGIMRLVANNGCYPTGVDTLCHIYKGDVLYKSIVDGNWWPAYDPLWYNGVEMLRYWAPLPVFILAGCEVIAGGNPLNGYLVFLGIIYFAGAMSWLVIGLRIKRIKMASFIGLLWFFVPSNMTQTFDEGNLPRTVCMIWLPLLICLVTEYLYRRKWSDVPKISLLFALTAICHSGYAGMMAIAIVIFCLIYSIVFRDWHSPIRVIIALILGYMLIGLWLVPSLIGGITSTDSSEIMQGYFQNLRVTLDPFFRMEKGGYTFYFGVSFGILGLFGMLLAKKEERVEFFSGIVIVALTSNEAYFLLSKLPGGQYLWMLRFLSIATCFVLFAFLMWRSLRRGWVIFFCFLLVLDSFSSYQLILGKRDGVTPEQRMEEYSEWTLLCEAKAMTKQRIALIDESKLDAMSAYLLTGYGIAKPTAYGAAWQSSSTATNFKQLDRSLEEGNYLYLFDRALEMGNDTVVVRTDLIHSLPDHSYEQMDVAAKRLGYELVNFNDLYRLYKLKNCEGNFGVISEFPGIAIGVGAGGIARYFPMFREVETTNLNEFSYDELVQYRVIYLDGFTYDDKEKAEDLILKLSEAGVHIIISADGIPEDRKSSGQSFLGVTCNKVQFSKGYPILETFYGEMDTDLFPAGSTEWSCVYVNGLDQVLGKVQENSVDIPFFGTVKNEDIVVIGLNLTYYYALTEDEQVGKLLNYAMNESNQELPKREIVLLNVEANNSMIRIESPKDGVNTTIAFHDSFVSEQEIWSDNHLTIVDKGTTVITLPYPYLREGLFTSTLALVLLVLYSVYLNKRMKESYNK